MTEKAQLTPTQADMLEKWKISSKDTREVLNNIVQFAEYDELWDMINALQYGYEIITEPKYKVVLSNGQTLVKGKSGEYYFDFLGENTAEDTKLTLAEVNDAEAVLRISFRDLEQISVKEVD